jgi:glycosyltransferase involved in cell wall biosynthesis
MMPAIGDRRPVLSICIPTFNRPDLVVRAIDSVIDSSPGAESSVEVIVSDNSPSVSEQVCRDALKRWQGRSTYIGHSPGIGMTPNFNTCIEQSSGEHILFLHDDDRLMAGAVSAILDALADRERPRNVLVFGVLLVDRADRVLRRQEYGSDQWVGPQHALRRLLSDNGIAVIPGLVVSRDAYEVVGQLDPDVGNVTDLEMCVRLFARFGSRTVPATIYAYAVHPGSTTQLMAFDGVAVARLMEVFQRARRLGVLPDETIRRCEARYLHQFLLSGALVNLRAGHVAGARAVMGLFQLPAVKALGRSAEWAPARLMMSLAVRTPPGLVQALMRGVDRFGLVRGVRALGAGLAGAR